MDKSLPYHIATLHIIYDKNKLNIMSFSHLVSFFPKILKSVKKRLPNSDQHKVVRNLLHNPRCMCRKCQVGWFFFVFALLSTSCACDSEIMLHA